MSSIIHLGQAITVVITTVANIEDATKMSKELIVNKYAACVQTTPITSYYMWEGKLQEDKEIRLMIKVIEEMKIEAVRFLKEYHPYEIPEIILTAFSSEKKYYEWCREVSGL